MEASTSFDPERRSTLRARHAEVTRSAIVAAARRLFAEQGYAGTSVRPIAQEAGVAIQTLYSTFGSKQGLLLALVDTVREESGAEELNARIRASADPHEMVRLAARVRRQILERCGDIVITFREGAAGDAKVAAAYAEGRRRTRESIGAMCSRLQALGALRPELTLASAVDQVAAMLAAEVFEELTGPPSGWSADAYERWLAEWLAAMLLRPGGPATASA